MTESLLEFARAHFALTRPDEKGQSRLKMLLDIRDQTGVLAGELKNLPSPPEGTEYLWAWFQALAFRRASGMALEALSWRDIQAFFGLQGVKPNRWELSALCALDDAYLHSRSSEGAKQAVGSAGAMSGMMPRKQE